MQIKRLQMSIVLESRIKSSGDKIEDWFIELVHLEDNKVEICNDMSEYFLKLEKMCTDYGIIIEPNENKWFQDESITSDQFSNINAQMRKYQEEIDNDSND